MDLGVPTPKTLSGARLLSHPSSGVSAAAVAAVLFLPFHTQIPYRRRHTAPPHLQDRRAAAAVVIRQLFTPSLYPGLACGSFVECN